MAPTSPPAGALPPTSEALRLDATRPYFLWWADATVRDLKRYLQSADPEERAYWLGALLREANSRDVWAFTTPAAVRAEWPRVVRHLGRRRAMWQWLLELPAFSWPPEEASHAR